MPLLFLYWEKPIVTVINGRFPGPTIYAREGDRVLVNVTNHAHARYNISIHWYICHHHHHLYTLMFNSHNIVHIIKIVPSNYFLFFLCLQARFEAILQRLG